MKFKYLRIAAITAVAMFLGSCVEEEVVGDDFSRLQKIYVENPEFEDDQLSRSCVDAKNSTSSVISFLWQPNDKLGAFSKDGNSANVPFSHSSSKNVASPEFTGEMSGTPYYVYFPYSEENDGRAVTNLKGTILAEQPYDLKTGRLSCDYKYGIRKDGTANKFAFKQLLSMLCITVDATGTSLQGECLNNVMLTITDKDGNQRPICGDFTFSAVDGTWEATGNTSGSLSMPWPTRPKLGKNKSYVGYVHVMPSVQVGDKLSVEVISEGHKASFSVTFNTAFQAGVFYNIPLTLKTYAANVSKYAYKETVIDRPTLTSFNFEVANNESKLLDNELKWNSSKHTPSFSGVSTYTAEVDNDKNEISLTIPYLYDFKLKPTFAVSADNSKVLVNGVEQTSEETEVDFTKPVTYTVVGAEGGTRDYTVKVTNTGLPVVVVKHSTTGDFDKVYNGGFNIGSTNIGGTLVNQFVDFMIRGKDTDWVTDDQITIYKADGTIDCEVEGGVRLRGNTSQVYPKKPFAMKFNSKKSVLGMPEHKRWVLLANWLDHSMIRNAVAFDIAQVMEYAWRENNSIEPGIPWNVHGQSVELVVVDKDGDAHHVGNYFLCEQIKIDENRLNITSPDGAETGSDYKQYGYLFEIDGNYDETSKFRTSNKLPFMFKDEVSSTILSSVQTKVQRIEDNIDNGNYDAAFEELDVNSVVDQFLIWELAMNREYGDPRSVYMYMDGDGKLSAGPVWDFDRGTFQNQELATSLGNSSSYRVKPDNEWICWRTQETEENDNGSAAAYVWYKQLIKSATFQQKVQERWAVIKPYLEIVAEQIAYYGQYLESSYKYDSEMWPTNTGDIKKYKSDFKDWSGDEELGANGNYQEVINNFITVYQERLAGMDGLITSGKFTK